MTGPQERWVTVRGARIRLRVAGDERRPPVLMLHGVGRSLEDWNEQFDRLADGYRLVAVDLPGFGRSEPVPEPVGLRAEAEAIWETLDAVGAGRPVHLVGNSLGGAVALQLLALDPGRVASVALLDSAGFGTEVTWGLRVLAVPGLGRRLLGRPHPKLAARTLRALFADPALVTAERVELALDLARHPSRTSTYLAVCRELGGIRGVRPQWRADLLATAARHPRPTLVVWGERDRILPAAHLRAAREAFPHGRFALLERTGHLPQIERPDEVARLLREHLGAAQAKVQPRSG
jgi:pimeloyl-ACP methyl ester carboxylesterase